MKNRTLTVLLLFLSMSCFAQIDIKTLYKTTPQAIIQQFGEPQTVDYGEDSPYDAVITYSQYQFILWKSASGNYSLEAFRTTSSAFCIMSDYIEGGRKVGDSFDKLSSYDFEHSRYGRGKTGNRLKPVANGFNYQVFSKLINYVAFEEEYETLYFAIEDNTIKAIVYSQKQDIPYPNYDGSNSLL